MLLYVVTCMKNTTNRVLEKHVTFSLAWTSHQQGKTLWRWGAWIRLSPREKDTHIAGLPGSCWNWKRCNPLLSSPPAYEICIHSNLTGSSPLAWCPHFTQLQSHLDSELPNNVIIWMLIGTKEKSQMWILKAVSEPPIPWQFSAP